MSTQPINREPKSLSGRKASGRGNPQYSPLLEIAAGKRRRVWTRAAYERATTLGMFGPEDRLELIEGEIIEKMPQNSPHATGINLSQEALPAA